MTYSPEELNEARRQIGSTLRKLEEVVSTLERRDDPARYKSQLTLAKRRIRAFTIADDLLRRELETAGPVRDPAVAAYISGLHPDGQRWVDAFAAFMEREYPQLREKLCFSMPMWLAGGRMREGYVAVSAAARHFSVHFSDEDFVQELGHRLPGCRTGKRCINVKYGDADSFAAVKAAVADFLHGQ